MGQPATTIARDNRGSRRRLCRLAGGRRADQRQVLAAARRLSCRAVLVDTFDKVGPGLTQLWSRAELQSFADAVRDHQLMLVLAGKITATDFDMLLPLEPDYLAVRGAACSADRTGQLDPAACVCCAIGSARRNFFDLLFRRQESSKNRVVRPTRQPAHIS